MNSLSRVAVAETGHSGQGRATRASDAADLSVDGVSATDEGSEGTSIRILIEHAREFIADFARYSGRKGIVAGALVAVGGMLEGVGLFLLIPILAIVMDTGKKTGWFFQTTSSLFKIAGTQTHFQQLVLLLSLFTALVIVRAKVSAKRDVALMELQTGFVENIRSRVARGLVAARWEFVARLRHARVTHVMSNGIQNIGAAINFLLQCIVSLTLILSQCILAFSLSPVLACLSLSLLASGGVALGLIMRHARSHGLFLTDSNLTLLNSTAQFLGGMKLAVSQNLQNRFIAEFEGSLQQQSSQQVRYARLRGNASIATTSMSALAAALIVLVGLGLMNIAVSQLIAMLYLFMRMSAPALQVQQGAQLFAVGLPAYEEIKELQCELSAASVPIAPAVEVAELSDATIVFRDVTFSHRGESQNESLELVLHDANLN